MSTVPVLQSTTHTSGRPTPPHSQPVMKSRSGLWLVARDPERQTGPVPADSEQCPTDPRMDKNIWEAVKSLIESHGQALHSMTLTAKGKWIVGHFGEFRVLVACESALPPTVRATCFLSVVVCAPAAAMLLAAG